MIKRIKKMFGVDKVEMYQMTVDLTKIFACLEQVQQGRLELDVDKRDALVSQLKDALYCGIEYIVEQAVYGLCRLGTSDTYYLLRQWVGRTIQDDDRSVLMSRLITKVQRLMQGGNTSCGAILNYMLMTFMRFKDVYFRCVHFRHCFLYKSSFVHCDVSYADFSFADLTGTVFDDTHLYGACFCFACLNDVDLRCRNLHGVSFYGARLEGANFIGAGIKYTDFRHTIWECEGCRWHDTKRDCNYFGAEYGE